MNLLNPLSKGILKKGITGKVKSKYHGDIIELETIMRSFSGQRSWNLGMCGCSGTQSCLTLCHPVDCSPPGPSVLGILQARTLEWVAISSSRGYSWPRLCSVIVPLFSPRVLLLTGFFGSCFKNFPFTHILPQLCFIFLFSFTSKSLQRLVIVSGLTPYVHSSLHSLQPGVRSQHSLQFLSSDPWGNAYPNWITNRECFYQLITAFFLKLAIMMILLSFCKSLLIYLLAYFLQYFILLTTAMVIFWNCKLGHVDFLWGEKKKPSDSFFITHKIKSRILWSLRLCKFWPLPNSSCIPTDSPPTPSSSSFLLGFILIFTSTGVPFAWETLHLLFPLPGTLFLHSVPFHTLVRGFIFSSSGLHFSLLLWIELCPPPIKFKYWP